MREGERRGLLTADYQAIFGRVCDRDAGVGF